MDRMISLGQKNTLAEYMILSGADNHPPMLDKDLYDSWKSRMELYMQNREHGRMILESVEHGPLIWPTVEENGVIRTKKYAELSAAEKIQADCDMKATNIILQGLPADIYSLERECKLYDAFDKFTHIKGESLHTYYLRFTQLINDMNIYKMKMEQFQVNTKFLNSLSALMEYSLCSDVKLVKDLHTSNFDQLHAYLEQHKLHANEVRIMHERNQDLLALVAYQSPQAPTQLMTESLFVDSGFAVLVFFPGDDPITCLNKAMAFLTAVASSREDKGKIILVILIEVMLLVQGEILQVDRQELLNVTTAKTKDLDTYDSDCDDLSSAQAVLVANISNYGSDVISEVPNSETYLNDMDNQKTQQATVQVTNLQAQQDLMILFVIEQIYKERVKTFEQRLNIDLSSREKMIDSQMDDMIREKLALKEQIDSLEQNLSKQIKEKESLFKTFTVFKNESKEKENKYMENEIDLEKKIKELDNIVYKVGQSAQTVHMLTKPQAFYDNTHKQALGYQNPFYLRKAQRIKPTLYDGAVISKTHVAMPVIDDEETLILEEESRSKMFEKAKDPKVIAKKISHKPIDYEKLNSLIKDFETLDVPSELPKVSLVNASLKKLKFHLTQFDFVVKQRTTPSALEEGEWGFEHTKSVFNNEIIPFLKYLKDIFNVFDKDLLNEITEVQTVFDQMEASVQQFSIDKNV
ncbi:hypothetical protein Tco_1003050 [Tanacetum coccineum]|uniref:Integrase, catalytic region, zinc finger, CCHC-type, peptidase aspartic, catalytic n=1 Tax=Tanacetum coccineum TaxID=301880 RepID=A0ABQ5F9W3_9ASTR